MRLTSVEYVEFPEQPTGWHLEPLTLGPVNLVVGKNASGKSRTLNIISGLSSTLSGKLSQLFTGGEWKATFERGDQPAGHGEKTRYAITFHNREVTAESLKFGRKTLLRRSRDGTGRLRAVKDRRDLVFQVPANQIVAVSRRDSLQHPYFDDLYHWASSVKHVRFGQDMGQTLLSVVVKAPDGSKPHWRDLDNNVAIFRRASDEFGDVFKQQLLRDFKQIGYDCTDVGLVIPEGLENVASPPPLVLYVQERDLSCRTTQLNMSTGMYRALCALISLNAGISAEFFQLLLIDDIGEGLDFERSRLLIQLLVARAKEHSFQLVMTSNDRFVMNAVPLEYWTVLHREGGIVKVFNNTNSRKLFGDFEYLGLNNFDFFSGKHFLTSTK